MVGVVWWRCYIPGWRYWRVSLQSTAAPPDTGDDPSYHHPSSPPLSPRQTSLKCHHIAGSSSGHPEKSCYLNTLNTLRNGHYTSGIVLLILLTMITTQSINLYVTINMYLSDVRKCRLFQGMSLAV